MDGLSSQSFGFRIRAATPLDASSILRVGRAIDRYQLANETSLRMLLERPSAATTERLVAERAGMLLAWAPSGIYSTGEGWFWIGVEQSHRRRGLGSHLYARIEARLLSHGATRLETTPNDDDGRQFLLARGFRVANVVRNAELDPRTVPPPPSQPDGIRVASLREASSRADALFSLYSEARADVLSARPRPDWTYDEWRLETIDSPLIDSDASVVVFEGDEPVALAWLYSDREGHRAGALMTATRRDRRGRGLATLAKVESARRAAGLGITRILTGNDLDNAPMLAVNRRLGFVPTATIESFAKTLTV